LTLIQLFFEYCVLMKIKFALVGCGRIALRHAEQIIKVGDLVAVCDIIESKANEMANTFGAKAYYDINEMLAEEIDVISICTPNGLHAEHTILALKHKKNVLCEKPLAINLLDAKNMLLAAAENNCKLFVVKQNRYNPPVIAVKEILKKNELGEILSFQINCFWNRPNAYYENTWKGTKKLDGGTLYTQFSHFIDIMYWLLGDVSKVKATISNLNHPTIDIEDTGAVIIELQSGSIGTLNYTVNAFAKNMEGSITIFGENGTVKIGGQYLNELEYQNIKNKQPILLQAGNTANNYGFYQGSMSNHDKVYENLHKAFTNKDYTIANAEDGLKTVEIIEKIYQSI
jgi:UDP-N-acetyl-2-amino-2-deoxyglucuronate dehydrogenase